MDAGIRSFKIEGRYKDIAYVKNATAHYRLLFDDLIDADPGLAHESSGRCRYSFTPDPERNFNRSGTDYFVNGRQADIGAFDSPRPVGYEAAHSLAVRAIKQGIKVRLWQPEEENTDALDELNRRKRPAWAIVE